MALLALRTALSVLAAFFLAVNLVWWVMGTQRLLRVLRGELVSLAFGQVAPALWFWFTGVLTVVVLPPLLAAGLAWTRRRRAALAALAILPLLTWAIYRWGEGFFPLYVGPGGYFIRTLPFGR